MLQKKYSELKQKIQLIDQAILNQDLHDYILEPIQNIFSSKKIKFNVIKTRISIYDQEDLRNFSLTVEPNWDNIQKITTFKSEFGGSFLETKEISFKGDTVFIIEQNHRTTYYVNIDKRPENSKIVKQKIYKNNQLSYEYQYHIAFDATLGKNSCSTIEKELYVLENRQAVLRQLVISEENAFYSDLPSISYAKNDNYDAPNYDTRVSNQGVYISEMKQATSEEFENLKKEYLEQNKEITKQFKKSIKH